MAYRGTRIQSEPEIQPNELRLPPINGGLCLSDLEMKIRNNQSPSMINMWFDDNVLNKRYGQENFLTAVIDTKPIYRMHVYKDKTVVHCGTKLYTLDMSTKAVVEIITGLPETKGTFFIFNDKLYYINGTKYIEWDNTTAIEVVGYIPVVKINCPPSGVGGDKDKDYNRIAAGFIVWFNGDATSTTYHLPQTNLDATTVTCTVDEVTKVEDTDFTVNRTTGVITPTTPSEFTSGTNNVKITAYKTNQDYIDSIINCKYAIPFGGENDTRVFFGGNGTSNFYFSSLLDPTYFPDKNYNIVGSNEEDITGFGEQYDVLVIFKRKKMFGAKYSFDGTTVRFPLKPVNSRIGCDMPHTIQLIDNHLVWCNTYAGVHILLSTEIPEERNVQRISRNINGTAIKPGLLAESDLINASSIDFKNKYWLCVGNEIYLWDYGITPYARTGDNLEDERRLSWFYFQNINAKSFIGINGDLYHGDRTTGNVVKFVNTFKDFGSSMPAKWQSKLMDFGLPDWVKTVSEIQITCRADTYSKLSMRYITEKDSRVETQDIVIGSFSWFNFAWDTFTWQVMRFAKTYRRRPNSKKINYWQIEISNDEAGRDLSILDLIISYSLERKNK